MGMRQLIISKNITNREAASLGKYLQEISKESLLSPEEEASLVEKAKEGEKDALDQLVRANLRFVVSAAKQYQGQGLPLSDLINEGNIGLIKAAGRFDPSRGFRFISFAVWWIRQCILEALANQSRLVRLPMNKIVMNNRIRNTHCELTQELERDPSGFELAEAMGVSEEIVADSILYNKRHESLDAPIQSDDGSNCLLDTLKNYNAIETDADLSAASLKDEISRALHSLPDRQRETLCYHFGIGVDHSLSLEDIGRKFDLTTERIRQIKDKAIQTLQKNKHFHLLRNYLGS